MSVSVVVCAKNEPLIDECIHGIVASGGFSQIVVVCADDVTLDLASLTMIHLDAPGMVLRSRLGSLPADRAVGAAASTGDVIVFIDADHRLRPGDLMRLVREANAAPCDVLQARLTITPLSFWNRAESEFLDMTMVPGVRDMVGVAPALFRREVLKAVKFDAGMTIDDTDLMYRLHRDTDYVTAVGTTVIECRHDPRLRDYLAKFRWYGTGDGQFMASHPERRRSMLFHLLIRYPLIYPLRAVLTGKFRAAPYAIVQGLARFRYSLTH